MNDKVISSVIDEQITFNHIRKNVTDTNKFNTHCHDRYEIIYFVEGDVSYIAEGRSYKLSQGDVVLSRPSVIHGIHPKINTYYERYDIIINDKLLPQSLRNALKSSKDVYHERENERVAELFMKLDDYMRCFSEEDFARLAFNITEEVLYNLTLSDGEDDAASVNPLIVKALDYIRDNLTKIRSVSEVSDALYITKSHLHHLFNEHLQMTPGKYINSKKLLMAQKKIKKGARPTAIYTDCGFEDYATFFRNYKRYFGYSPAEEGLAKSKREILF